jgi:hypothetical protein
MYDIIKVNSEVLHAYNLQLRLHFQISIIAKIDNCLILLKMNGLSRDTVRVMRQSSAIAF